MSAGLEKQENSLFNFTRWDIQPVHKVSTYYLSFVAAISLFGDIGVIWMIVANMTGKTMVGSASLAWVALFMGGFRFSVQVSLVNM